MTQTIYATHDDARTNEAAADLFADTAWSEPELRRYFEDVHGGKLVPLRADLVGRAAVPGASRLQSLA